MKYSFFRIELGVLVLCTGSILWGQTGAGVAKPSSTAKASAPIDLTGYWVSVITEDWR